MGGGLVTWTSKKHTPRTNASQPKPRKNAEGMKNGTRCSTNHSAANQSISQLSICQQNHRTSVLVNKV